MWELYPNIVRIFGYSSRNQQDRNKYVEILQTRMKAKHKQLSQDFLDSLNVTNDDLKSGLKLPINAYTGALRAKWNNLYDPVQGFSICATGQLLILQLIYDLQQIKTVEMVESNTDAVKFYVDEEYKPQVLETLHNWEQLTGLELEEDNIVKCVARDVNNFCEILQTGDNDFKVNYKGGEFKGKHKFKWDKDNKTFKYSFDDDIEANSMTIVGEALLKNLLFNIPIETTINNCNDIFRFQIITHLGGTYEKIVQETTNGDVELQRNNRIYATNIPNGLIVKIKYDGRRDSLANCPPNPMVDNGNTCTIDDINKEWYIEIAKQKLNDFLGIKRLEDYKKEELLQQAYDLGLDVEKKIKKADLIELIKARKREDKNMTKKVEKTNVDISSMNLGQKINAMKKEIKNMEFVMDSVQAGNLGGKEYPSIGQYYRAITDLTDKYNILFTWDVVSYETEKDMFKPQGKMPQHVTTVTCMATLYDLDSKKDDCYDSFKFSAVASGSDTCDKGVSAASSMAFRNWFDKNFAPSYLTVEDFNSEVETATETEIVVKEEKTVEPKVPTFIPPEKKEEITQKVVAEVQQEESDKDDIKRIIDKVMEVRSITGNDNWGATTLESIMAGNCSTADLVSIELKIDNKLDAVKEAK